MMKSLSKILEFGYYSILLYCIFNSIAKKEKKKSIEEASTAIFPNDLMVEIVSWLPVKYVIQLRCLSKFFNTLIFDPHFVQMHLNKSTQNLQFALTCFDKHNWLDWDNPEDWNSRLITLSIPCLLQNQFTILNHSDPYYRLNVHPHIIRWIVGSCNGLLCVFGMSSRSYQWLYFWNPAMRKESKKFTLFFNTYSNPNFNFSFGYDNSSQTYKVVAFYAEVKPDCNPKSVVKVFSLGDNSWRGIQCLPLLPLQRLDKVPHHPPELVILMDCLCFCHDFEKTHFVIWQMKDFGVHESWLQLFKISYDNFAQVNLLPLYLSENGDTLVLANDEHGEAFIYNRRDNKVEKIRIANRIEWAESKDYVESLVSTH